MESKILKLNIDSNASLPSHMCVWATEKDIRAILPDGMLPDNQPNYVKITSKNPLAIFTFYANIQIKTNGSDGQLWVPDQLRDSAWVWESGMEVVVSYLDVKTLPKAEDVTVRFNPKDVIFWGEDEELAAKGAFPGDTVVVYLSQKVLVKPRTKDNVIGELISIRPNPESHNHPYLIDDSTNIVFEDLPHNKQKTIDFSKIGGLDTVINRLREIIQIPINFPELLERFGINPPKGMILYGPPGNGKTMIARAIAHSMGASFIEIDRSKLLDQYVGVSEKNLTKVFKDAFAKSNSVIFIDEIDSLAAARTEKSEEHQVSLIATFLVLMDGINSNQRTFVIGATNRLEAVDPAFRRPGRFDLEFEVPLPDQNGRLDILQKYVPMDKPNLLEDVDDHKLVVLSELTSGYSGADMSMLYREAAMQAIRRNMKLNEAGKIELKSSESEIKLRYDDFIAARKDITPTQMRGERTMAETSTWDEIVGLDQQKNTLQQVNDLFSKCIDSDMLQNRPRCANLLLVGRRGTGKRTLVTAFAKKFGYELLSIDCVELEALSIGEVLQEIHRVVVKCRQSVPSILFIQNLEDCQYKETIAHKVINEISRLSRRLKVMAVLTCEDVDRLPLCVRGYKAFEKEISFDIDEASILEGIMQLFPAVRSTPNDISGKTIGQAIRDLREELLIGELDRQ